MRLREILKLKQGLENLYNKHLPIKLSFSIAKNLREIKEYQDFYEKERIKLIKYYAEKDENDEPIVDEKGNVKIKNLNKFLFELDQLLDSEQKIQITKIPMEIIEKCENDKIYDLLTLKEVNAITWMIDMEG